MKTFKEIFNEAKKTINIKELETEVVKQLHKTKANFNLSGIYIDDDDPNEIIFNPEKKEFKKLNDAVKAAAKILGLKFYSNEMSLTISVSK